MLPRVPFVSFVLFFILGILAGDGLISPDFLDILSITYFETAVILLIAAVSFWFYQKRKYPAYAISFLLFLSFSGMLCIGLHQIDLKQDVEKLTENKYDYYEAVVMSLSEKRAKSLRVDVLIERININKKWFRVDVKALLSIPLTSAQVPAAHDILIVKGNPELPNPPMNPHEFDYKRYLWNKGIVWTDYLPEGSYQIIRNNDISGNVKLWSIQVSEWADKQLRTNLKDEKSYGLVKAMLLGRRDDLRSDQIDDYTTSGTVHILSVSGMHVAIIFLVITFLLGWVKRLRGGKFVYLTIVISLMCFYALVTGLAPSVLRATLMCIVFVLAEVFSKKNNGINTLAISALIILLIDPQALFDVGFQLSYLAMTGIFLFYKPIETIWSPSNRVTKYLWQITALSFAAQLATFPVSLYYFHQFPFYFWLVNPFVITLTNLLLPAALLLLLTCLLPFAALNLMIGHIVDFLSYLTNFSVTVPKVLPGYLIENLYLDKVEVLVLYAVLFMFWHAYDSREFYKIKYAVLLVFGFILYSSSMSIQQYVTPKGMIHAVPKHTVMSFKDGNKMYFASDKAFEMDTNAFKFYIKNYAVSEGVTETNFVNNSPVEQVGDLYKRKLALGNLFYWHGKLIYSGLYIPTKAALDYAIISSPRYPGIKRIQANKNTVFLLSGENKRKTQQRWIDLIAQENCQMHNLLTDGAILLP
ncbi:ComEC/Rec2 family competence protein [Dyadobacter sp. CY356]|uniref:ComEC/Rec2 family competence protein n=1 Tax=Dyadobacter sp. CY356 TaxID=2906442 RepID=UPI001F448AE4|nr:ComEC/Rec2 family competence protein [Dyadobacter sp. CY356]MCF0055576.1 ComEC family competence protein [Dyadobacter sp. CY356]